jgi:hypothetical protein
MPKIVPFDGLIDAQIQIILLYSYEHEGKHAAAECIGSFLDELGTPMARLVHFCETEISIVNATD